MEQEAEVEGEEAQASEEAEVMDGEALIEAPLLRELLGEDPVAQEITDRDVLLTLAMEQLEHGEKVDVIATLETLGLHEIVETAKIARDVEEEEELGNDPEVDELEAELNETAGPRDSELE